MRAAPLALLLAALLAGGPAGLGGQSGGARICASLEEAAPSGRGPVLLVFFSTDCAACFDDLFEARLLVEKGGWPVAVVGVFSGLRDELQTFLEKYAWSSPVVLDRRKILFKKFKVNAVPDKVLLVGAEAAYRDDPYREPAGRREELERCLKRLFSR